MGKILLAATNDGVCQITGSKALAGSEAAFVKKSVNNSFQPSWLYRSKQDTNRVYVGLFDGLASLRWNGKWIDEGRINGIQEAIRNLIESEDGTLWLGTESKGVIRVKFPEGAAQASLLPKNPTIERFGTEHGLPQGGVAVFAVAGGEFFAMKDGLFRFDQSRGVFIPDSTFRMVGFGGSAEEYSLKEDRHGNVWINFGRETAVALRQPDGSYLPEKTPFLRIADLRAYSMYIEDDGVAWFGSEAGVIRYDPHIQRNYAADYPALIRRVTVDEDSVIFGGTDVETSGPDVSKRRDVSALSYAHNALRFEFSASSFEAESENQFQTFLEGFDDHWSNWSKENKRDYTNLPPGDYRFRVKANNIYQHESNEAMYEFKILPPWYRTTWAYLFYLLAAGGFVFGLIRMRTRQLETRHRELEKTVEERTAEIQKQKENVELLSEIGKEITASLDMDTIFFQAIRARQSTG
jgi:ligand-binding sensor domain-containing protein